MFEKEDFIVYGLALKIFSSREDAEMYWEDEKERELFESDMIFCQLLYKDIEGTPITTEEFHERVKIIRND